MGPAAAGLEERRSLARGLGEQKPILERMGFLAFFWRRARRRLSSLGERRRRSRWTQMGSPARVWARPMRYLLARTLMTLASSQAPGTFFELHQTSTESRGRMHRSNLGSDRFTGQRSRSSGTHSSQRPCQPGNVTLYHHWSPVSSCSFSLSTTCAAHHAQPACTSQLSSRNLPCHDTSTASPTMGLSKRRRYRSFHDRDPRGDVIEDDGDAGGDRLPPRGDFRGDDAVDDVGLAASPPWLPDRSRRTTTRGRGDSGAVGATSRADVRVANDSSSVSACAWELDDGDLARAAAEAAASLKFALNFSL
mmetsp:Transcript_9435/g.28812  ORF Transcript_9435/g.28812 Transcript_9435/m.28812 type:complete len:307 (-) Transcript_9435:600-1520(-)